MPLGVSTVANAGTVHPNPFVGPVNHTATVRVDVSGLSSDEVDSNGYLRPGVLLTRDGLLVSGADALLSIGTLAISGTAEKFKTTTTLYALVNGVQITKTATDNLTFSAAHVVTANLFGAILLQIDVAGNITTYVGEATQTTAMGYASAALAIAALPAAEANKTAIGYIVVNADTANWTANTDDLTDGSDLTTASFVDGALVSGTRNPGRGYGAVVEAVKVAAGNTSALLNAATDIDVAVATICQINRAILEDSLGRVLTDAELSNISDSIVIMNNS